MALLQAVRRFYFAMSLLALTATGAQAGGEPISVSLKPVPLSLEEAEVTQVGALFYRGGFALSSSDKRFGGLSGLWVAPEGDRLVAVSDSGYWLDANLTITDGRLAGLDTVRIGPMLNGRGRSITGKSQGDAEAIARDGDDFLVSFERDHRVWRYAAPDGRAPFDARPEPLPRPAKFGGIPNNRGLEGIEVMDGRLLMMSEGALDRAGNIRGWVGPVAGRAEDFSGLTITINPPYAVTDLAALPGGDVLVLERRYSPLTGPGMQIRRTDGADWAGGAVLDGPVIGSLGIDMTVDNMEGLSTHILPTGETALFIVSDDNYNPLQRTLLMMFVLDQ